MVKIMLPIRKTESLVSEIGLLFSQSLPLQIFDFDLVFEYALTFENLISSNSYSRHIKLPERIKEYMVHYSISDKFASYLNYSKYGAITLLMICCITGRFEGFCSCSYSSCSAI
jgi:hypothetical protein